MTDAQFHAKVIPLAEGIARVSRKELDGLLLSDALELLVAVIAGQLRATAITCGIGIDDALTLVGEALGATVLWRETETTEGKAAN